MKKIFGLAILGFLVPAFASAAQIDSLGELLDAFGRVISLLIPIAGAAALLFFIWGMAKFVLHSGDIEGRKEGKQIMLWGIVALFIIFSIWGIIGLLQEDLGVWAPYNLDNDSGLYEV